MPGCADPRQGPSCPENRRIFVAGAAIDDDPRFRSTAAFDRSRRHRYSIQELTSLLVSGLEDARKRDGTVDARHVVAEVSESIRRRDPDVERRNSNDADYEATSASAATQAVDEYDHFLPNSTRSLGMLAAQWRGSARSHPQARAATACVGDFQADHRQPGIKLNLSKSAASIAVSDGALTHRNRMAAVTFGFPKSGFCVRVQFTSSRKQMHTEASENNPRLGYGRAVCALVATVILLYALPGFRTKQPQRLGVSLVQSEKTIALRSYLPGFLPISSAMTWSPEKKPVEAVPASVTVEAPEHMATRATTNIRLRPEHGAQVVRVVPGRLILTVHARHHEWVQVGGANAWGWVPFNLLDPFASKG